MKTDINVTNKSMLVDFSHGDVDALKPIPRSLEKLNEEFYLGGKQAYTEYKGKKTIRNITNKSMLVEFTHGNIDTIKLNQRSIEKFNEGFYLGGKQAYTEYKGKKTIRDDISEKISRFTNTQIESDKNLIITS